MTDRIKTASNVTERRGSSAIDRNIASNAEAVAAGMSVAAGSLILGALLPHRADAKNQADLPAGKTDPHPDAASHFVSQGDDAPPHVGQSAPTPAANPGTIDPTHATDQSVQPHPDAMPVHQTDGQTGADAFASAAATVTDASHSVADDAHYAAATADQTTTIAASETASQWHADSIDPAVTLLGQITATVYDATAAISNSLAGTTEHLITTVGNLTHAISETFRGSDGQLPGGGVDSLLQNVGQAGIDATASLGGTTHSAVASPVTPAATNLAADAGHTADSAVDVFSRAMTLREDFHAVHIGFIGQSMANTVDATDISTHALGSILHGYV